MRRPAAHAPRRGAGRKLRYQFPVSASALLLTLLLTTASVAAPPPEARQAPALPARSPDLLVGEVTTPRFRIRYTRRAAGAARELAKRIEVIRDDFQRTLRHDWEGVTEIRLGVGREEFEGLALPGGTPPSWAVALAYPDHDLLLLEAASLTLPGGFETIRHELAHVALGRLAPGWPRWFQEGLAQHLSGERSAVSRYTAMFRAVRQDRVFEFEDLAQGWPQHPSDVEIAYAQSEAFVAFLLDRHGTDALGKLITELHGGANFDLAFARAFQTTVRLEEQAFRERLPRLYAWLPFTLTSSLVWIAGAALTVIGVLRLRAASDERRAQMDLEQAEEEAAELRALEQELAAAHASESPEAPATDPPENDSSKPTVH